MQKLLGELDMPTLVTALVDADEGIRQRIFGNLSRRAREALEEELGLVGSVPDEELEAAERRIVEVLVQLDEQGDLEMMPQTADNG
jgi:flagellar motor switch protein FliG